MSVLLAASTEIPRSAVKAGAASLLVVTVVSLITVIVKSTPTYLSSSLDSQERGSSHDRLARRKHGDSRERGESRGRLARRRHGGQ